MSEPKIWKPTLHALLNEAFAPFYINLEKLEPVMGDEFSWVISVAGWSDEDRLCEWRVAVAAPLTRDDAEQFKYRVITYLREKVGQDAEIREGAISETTVYGELPEEIRG